MRNSDFSLKARIRTCGTEVKFRIQYHMCADCYVTEYFPKYNFLRSSPMSVSFDTVYLSIPFTFSNLRFFFLFARFTESFMFESSGLPVLKFYSSGAEVLNQLQVIDWKLLDRDSQFLSSKVSIFPIKTHETKRFV